MKQSLVKFALCLGVVASLWGGGAKSAFAAPLGSGSAPTNPHPGAKYQASPVYVPKKGSPTLASVLAANAQPAILTTTSASDQAVVFSDASNLPTPAQKLVTGVAAGANPQGVAYFGSDSALISDFRNARIYVAKVSTGQVLSTLTTTNVYDGTGAIAVAPNLSTALANGGSTQLLVIKAPFNSASATSTVALPGFIANYQTQAIVFNNAGRAFIYHTNGISVLDPPYTSVAFTIPVANAFSGALAISPDGNTLMATDLTTNVVKIFKAPFSAASTATSLTISRGSTLDGICITPDGTKAIVVSAFGYYAAAISAPFSTNSTVADIPLPSGSALGFEDVGISADSQTAILSGNNGGPPVFVVAPFGAASQSFAVPILNTTTTSRGNGAARFIPPGLAPGLTVSKSAPASVVSGSNLTYTLTYQNTGSVAASNVVITDKVPTGTTFVSATGGGTLSSGNVVFNIGAVAANSAAKSVTFTVKVTAAAGATISNDTYNIAATGVSAIAGPPVTTSVTAAPATLSITGASVTEGDSGTRHAAFTVTLSKAVATNVTVKVSTSNGSATAGSDYVALSNQTITFTPGGELTQTVNVVVNGDTTVEPDETFTVTLSGPVGAILGTATATGNILNDDSFRSATLSVGNASVTEGNSGTTDLNFIVRVSDQNVARNRAIAAPPITVRYATSDGSATAGSDYVVTSGTLNIPANASTATITVKVNGDTVFEPNETLTLTLSNPSGATITTGTATGTIINDDAAPLPKISIGNVLLSEGNSGTQNAAFTVRLSSAPATPVTVDVSTRDNTATAGSDYIAVVDRVLTFAPNGPLTQTVNVVVNGDTDIEADESFFVTLSNPVGATLANASATGTIVNDDFSGPQVVTGQFTITVGKLVPIGPYTPGLYRAGGRFVEDITLRNKGNTTITGPLYFVADNLPNGVELMDSDGVTSVRAPFGSPYMTKTVTLAPKGSVTVRLQFRLTKSVKPSFTPRVLAGPGTP